MNAEDVFYYSKLSQINVEEWVPIPEYQGFYEVSNLGRVRSVDRVASHPQGPMKLKGQAISTYTRKTGYVSVGLNKNARQQTLDVHSLVALSFIGPRPAGLQVCHNNGNASDNRLNNIRYDTPKNNSDDAVRHGTKPRGSKQGHSKLTEDDVREIKSLIEVEGLSQKKIAKRFGVTPGTIAHINAGRNWAHI